MGVQGFPTLKIVRPGKMQGKPTVEDYQGERSAKGIVNAVKDKVPNVVKRVNDMNLDAWLQENKDRAKAILFSEKGIVSATLRALAIDFAGLVSVAQIKKSEKAAVEKYGITEYPSLVLLPTGSEEAIKFDGKIEKEAMVEFLSQVAPPNPDCPPAKGKKPKAKKDDKKASKSLHTRPRTLFQPPRRARMRLWRSPSFPPSHQAPTSRMKTRPSLSFSPRNSQSLLFLSSLRRLSFRRSASTSRARLAFSLSSPLTNRPRLLRLPSPRSL
jgi:hypothetical protein